MPECAVPDEIYSTTNFSSDIGSLSREKAKYVPENLEDTEDDDLGTVP